MWLKKFKRTPYTIPHIKYILNNMSNFTYATTFNLIMGYYNIWLTDVANKICTTTPPFRKYKYNHPQMGVWIAPYIFQERISALMEDLYFVIFCLEIFIIITSGPFGEHLAKSKDIMKHLHLAGLKFNIDKFKFAVHRVEYLVYIIVQ